MTSLEGRRRKQPKRQSVASSLAGDDALGASYTGVQKGRAEREGGRNNFPNQYEAVLWVGKNVTE